MFLHLRLSPSFLLCVARPVNKYQPVSVHWWLLWTLTDKHWCLLAYCLVLIAFRPRAAEGKGSQQINSCHEFQRATGQAAARHAVHIQGTWPWVNWQMPGFGAGSCDPEDVVTLLPWTHQHHVGAPFKTFVLLSQKWNNLKSDITRC